jgi:hypothetical protein
MCDYSLEQKLSRAAKVGDKLVTKKFGVSGGFVSVDDTDTCVCLQPGTELAFSGDHVDVGGVFWLTPISIQQNVARFRQLDLDEKYTHHDALEFADGTVVKLTRLREDQEATVLQLPVVEPIAPEQKQEEAPAKSVETV